MDVIIDHGVRSLVERNAPSGHLPRIRARLAGRPGWAQPVLIARPDGRAYVSVAKAWSYMAAALFAAAIGAGLWTLRDSREDALEPRVVRQAPHRAPFGASPARDLRPPGREHVALRSLPRSALPPPEVAAARAAREAEASRAKLMAYLEALYQLPPEVLAHEPPSAAEPLPEPSPMVIPEIVITPLRARAESEDDALPDFSPRGEE